MNVFTVELGLSTCQQPGDNIEAPPTRHEQAPAEHHQDSEGPKVKVRHWMNNGVEYVVFHWLLVMS